MLFKAETAGLFGGEGCQGDKDGEDRFASAAVSSRVRVYVHHIDYIYISITWAEARLGF